MLSIYGAVNQRLPQDASPSEIEATCIELAKRLRAEGPTSIDAKIKLFELENAYEILGNPSSRADYDQSLITPKKDKPPSRFLSNPTALIRCKDCGRRISKQASACPGCGAPVPRQNVIVEEDETTTGIGIAALVLGLASITMPYIAAVFLVPAALVTGIIAFRRGRRTLGGAAIVLAILGVVGIISVSNKIGSELGSAQRQLEHSFRTLK